MNPTEFTPMLSLLGGMLIGLSAVLLMLFNGRIAGISGIVKSALFDKERLWRWCFLIGLIFGGFAAYQITDFQFKFRQNYPIILIVIGGLFVGVGTSLGSGCTSGHGVCGMARLSKRSIVATMIYLSVGIISAILTLKFFGGLI